MNRSTKIKLSQNGYSLVKTGQKGVFLLKLKGGIIRNPNDSSGYFLDHDLAEFVDRLPAAKQLSFE